VLQNNLSNTTSFTETEILVHFYKNFQDIIIITMTFAVFHDLPGLENGLAKFYDFP